MRVLLCHVDVQDSEKPLLDMNKMAVLNDFTFILAWSLQVLEAGAQIGAVLAIAFKFASL